MSSAVSTEPEIAIGGVSEETAVHNNRGDSCETQSAQALAAAVSRALRDVVGGVNRAQNRELDPLGKMVRWGGGPVGGILCSGGGGRR